MQVWLPVHANPANGEENGLLAEDGKLLRDALYMPALVAIRFNHDMKDKYEHLKAAVKPSKVAITAIMRKLIILANALGPVANHRDAIRAAARLQLAAQMQSVLSQRVAMPLNSLIPAK